MPDFNPNGQPVEYTVMEGRRIVRRGMTTQNPLDLLNRERRINPNRTVKFHYKLRLSKNVGA